jgi:hypothetical protein
MDFKDEIYRVTEALADAQIGYALCGGVAVIIHGYPRSTKDIDILLREGDLDKAIRVLEEIGYDLPGGIIPFDTGLPTERRVFRVSKAEGRDYLTLDVIIVSPFLADVWSDREDHLVEGRILSVVSKAGLVKMKKVAGRPQDLVDLKQLGLDGQENE